MKKQRKDEDLLRGLLPANEKVKPGTGALVFAASVLFTGTALSGAILFNQIRQELPRAKNFITKRIEEFKCAPRQEDIKRETKGVEK